MNGPFETEREARAAAHSVVTPDDGWSILHRDQNRLLLERACSAADVELGAFDRRILDWLSGFEDSTCSVIAGLIARASAAKAAPLPESRAAARAALRAYTTGEPASDPDRLSLDASRLADALGQLLFALDETHGEQAGKPEGACSQCGGPIAGYADPYDVRTARWRHDRLPAPVAEFLDAEHSPEPRQDAAGSDRDDKAAAQPISAAAGLAEVRRVLDAFDWETGDRQYALEAINRII